VKIPRNFGIDPTGRWLIAAGFDSDSVVVFSIDAQTGKLTPTGQSITIPQPVCVKFLKRN
jgi:6-phosphogluconolactonase